MLLLSRWVPRSAAPSPLQATLLSLGLEDPCAGLSGEGATSTQNLGVCKESSEWGQSWRERGNGPDASVWKKWFSLAG